MTATHTRIVRRCSALLGALLPAAALGLLLATPATAHAVLQSATPPDGAELEQAPSQVELVFNEPVEVPSDGLRVYDAEASRVDTGLIDDGAPETVAAGLPDDLPDGGYVITYRVVSTDDHPIDGVLTFTVGDAEAVDDTVTAELFGGAGSSATGVAGPLLRGLGYVATFLAAGAVAIGAVVARRDEHRDLARRVGTRAALAGIALTLVAVPVQGAAVGGVGVLEAATSPRILTEVLGSGFGEGTLIRLLALVVIATVWRRPTPALLVGIAAGGALGSYLRDGHQRTVEPLWVMVAGDAIHVAAGAMWLAGLVLLVLILRRTARTGTPVAAARYLADFSTMALVSVALLTASGVAMATPLVGSVGGLTSTPYGWLLVAKVSAVALVVVIALYNRQRLLPVVTAAAAPRGGSAGTPPTADDEALELQHSRRFGVAWGKLLTAVRVEALILIAILLVTGFLVSQQPAADAAGLRGLYETTAPLGEDLELDVVVDPNQVGRNAIHLYVVDATGRPSGDVEDVTLELTYLDQGIGPIVIDPLFAGPGHWIANTDDLRFSGDWQLRVVVGVDRFTERTAEVTIPVAG